MSYLKRLFPLVLVLSLLAVSPVAAQSPSYESAPCMFDLPPFTTEGEDIVCGYLTVPEQHGDPAGPTLKLAVAILKSRNPNPAPDPLVMAQGGPGGSTIDFAQVLVNSPLRENRDLILFDQRGTLYSEPNLLCPEFITLTAETIEKDIPLEGGLKLSEGAMLACHDRLVGEGVNLAAFNSLENAADVEDLRVALGYDQINFYGISYGTLLAQHLMRDYPAGLRSVILDAVVSPEINFVIEAPRTIDRAFSELFKACAVDVTCQADYPNLEQRFFHVVARLNEQPAIVPMTDPETGQSYDAVLSGDSLVDILFQFLYQTDFIPVLPKLIDNIEAGDYTILSNIWPLLLFERTFSLGMYQSVICAEDADFRVEDIRVGDIRPELAANVDLENGALLRMCQQWNVPPLGPAVDEPVVSEVPTLLLSGQFDPITPPEFAEMVAQGLPNSYHFVFPRNGHGAALPGEPCVNRIIVDFLSNPNLTPKAGCLAAQPQTPHFLPANTLTIPLIGALAVSPDYTHLLQFSLAGLSLLVLLSAWLIWPLLLLIHWLRHKALPPSSWGATLGRTLALLVGLVATIFLVGLVGAVLLLVFNPQNLAILFVGLSAVTTPLFLLPPLLILMALLMLLVTVLAWWRGYWSVWGRIYYTLLTLFALVYVIVLMQWGMLGVLV